MNSKKNEHNEGRKSNCNVNSGFNFTVGGFAIAAGLFMIYLAYRYFVK